jgi:hypothetical protein
MPAITARRPGRTTWLALAVLASGALAAPGSAGAETRPRGAAPAEARPSVPMLRSADSPERCVALLRRFDALGRQSIAPSAQRLRDEGETHCQAGRHHDGVVALRRALAEAGDPGGSR